jgi:hypothetical protein
MVLADGLIPASNLTSPPGANIVASPLKTIDEAEISTKDLRTFILSMTVVLSDTSGRTSVRLP